MEPEQYKYTPFESPKGNIIWNSALPLSFMSLEEESPYRFEIA